MDPASSLSRVADQYWMALVHTDAEAAYAVVDGLVARGIPVPDVLTHVVVGGQRRIGEHWAAADWTVGQEHAATAVSEGVVRQLMSQLPPVDESLPPLLVACAERESHTMAALVVTASLRCWGWPAHDAGSLTGEALTHRIVRLRPAAVLISASLTSSLTRLARQIAAITETGVPVIAGGSALGPNGDRALRLGATAYAETPEAARTILASIPRVVAAEHTSPEHEAYRLERQADDLARTAVEATMWMVGNPAGAVTPDHWSVVLTTFTPHLVAAIAGGVLLADREVPEAARAWLERVLVRRRAPEGVTDVLWSQLRDGLRDYPNAWTLVS